jgi:flagellar protein FliS
MLDMNAVNIYRQNQVNTASPQELALMLFNGGIRFLKLAQQAIAEKKHDEAHQHLIRVQDIISELELGLNRDVPIAKEMAALYDFMKYRTIQANLKKDPAIVKEVLGFFTEFRDTWKQAMELSKKGTNNG